MTGARNDPRRADLPRTERPDAPAYLRRYQSRGAPPGPDDHELAPDADVPLYLRRFRERQASPAGPDDLPRWTGPDDLPRWNGEDLSATRAWADVTRTKEIVPERRDQQATVVTDVYFVRHGETQGYSSESGLTPLGSWQAHRRGQEIARRVQTGHRVIMACAPTNRARQTAEHLRRGLADNLRLFGRDAEVSAITAMPEFGNFAVATPMGRAT